MSVASVLRRDMGDVGEFGVFVPERKVASDRNGLKGESSPAFRKVLQQLVVAELSVACPEKLHCSRHGHISPQYGRGADIGPPAANAASAAALQCWLEHSSPQYGSGAGIAPVPGPGLDPALLGEVPHLLKQPSPAQVASFVAAVIAEPPHLLRCPPLAPIASVHGLPCGADDLQSMSASIEK